MIYESLMKALVLVDARNGRLTDLDELFMDLLQQTSVPHQVCLFHVFH